MTATKPATSTTGMASVPAALSARAVAGASAAWRAARVSSRDMAPRLVARRLPVTSSLLSRRVVHSAKPATAATGTMVLSVARAGLVHFLGAKVADHFRGSGLPSLRAGRAATVLRARSVHGAPRRTAIVVAGMWASRSGSESSGRMRPRRAAMAPTLKSHPMPAARGTRSLGFSGSKAPSRAAGLLKPEKSAGIPRKRWVVGS